MTMRYKSNATAKKKSVFAVITTILYVIELIIGIGGTIYIDNKLCAFTVGERLHPHMQLIHIEKGDTDYEGIFPMINQQYVLHECGDVELINREEDMGMENLRQTKLSYKPVRLAEKYSAVWKQGV